jgi:multidrug transporter EmrE-like cation transporter
MRTISLDSAIRRVYLHIWLMGRKYGRGPVKLFWKVLLSLLVAIPLYWAMVTAFHLLNLPSNVAVLGGIGLLLLVAICGWFAFRRLWRRA